MSGGAVPARRAPGDRCSGQGPARQRSTEKTIVRALRDHERLPEGVLLALKA